MFKAAKTNLTPLLGKYENNVPLQFYLKTTLLTIASNWSKSFSLIDRCSDARDSSQCFQDKTDSNKLMRATYTDLLFTLYMRHPNCSLVKQSSFFRYWDKLVGAPNIEFAEICP
jgi:hypothetical protein